MAPPHHDLNIQPERESKPEARPPTARSRSRASAIVARLLDDSLRRSHLSILISSGANVLFGFGFWVVAARLYSAPTVGLVTGAVSAAAFLGGISNSGLQGVLIRFLAGVDARGRYVGTALVATAITSAVAIAVFLAIQPEVVPSLNSLHAQLSSAAVFVTLVLAIALGEVIDGVFISLQRSGLLVFRNLIGQPGRFLAVVLLGGTGVTGLLFAHTLFLAVGTIIGFALMRLRVIHQRLSVSRSVIRTIGPYALSSSISNGFAVALTAIVPLIVLARLGPTASAHFYLPMLVASMLTLIPAATSKSLVALSSASPATARATLFAALRDTYIILVPACIVLMSLGPLLLKLLGGAYATAGSSVLEILVPSSLVATIATFGSAWLSVHLRIRAAAAVSGVRTVVVLSAVYFLAPSGLSWVAVGWLAAQGTMAVGYLLLSPYLLRLG